MLTKEELLKNYENLKNYWLSEGVEEIFSPDERAFMKKYDSDIDKRLINISQRYWAIRRVGNIIKHYKDYEERINKFVSSLKDKWADLWAKSFTKFEKEACHWKREGYESKEAYKEYLDDTICDTYGWNSDNAYAASVIENQLRDISEITKEYYELSY